jgi:hypothetical protein
MKRKRRRRRTELRRRRRRRRKKKEQLWPAAQCHKSSGGGSQLSRCKKTQLGPDDQGCHVKKTLRTNYRCPLPRAGMQKVDRCKT